MSNIGAKLGCLSKSEAIRKKPARKCDYQAWVCRYQDLLYCVVMWAQKRPAEHHLGLPFLSDGPSELQQADGIPCGEGEGRSPFPRKEPTWPSQAKMEIRW